MDSQDGIQDEQPRLKTEAARVCGGCLALPAPEQLFSMG